MTGVRAADQPDFFTPFWRDLKGSVSGLFIYVGSNDYVETTNLTFVQWMAEVLERSNIPDIVIFSPGSDSEKIKFPRPSTKATFVRTLGLDKKNAQPALPAGNPFADFSNSQQATAQPVDPMNIELPNDYASAIAMIVRFLKLDGAKRKLTPEDIRTAKPVMIEVGDDQPPLRGLALKNGAVIDNDARLGVEREYTLEELGESRIPCAAAIIEDADAVVPGEGAQMATLTENQRSLLKLLGACGTDGELIDSGNPLILLTSVLAKLNKEVSNARGVTTIRLPRPEPVLRRKYIETLVEGTRVGLAKGLTTERLATMTAGLELRDHQDIFLRAGAMGQPVTADLALARRREIIEATYGGLIELRQPKYGFDAVGGHPTAKKALTEWFVEPLRDGVTDVYMGLAFLGPAGTLKTTLAEAFAYELGEWNFIVWNAANVRGSLQGETEANAEMTFEAIRAARKAVVFVDEADKAFGTPGAAVGGAGVAENNLLAMTQAFMSTPWHRGEIIWVFASNYPELIPAALFRPGRIDMKIPLLTPDDGEERADVFEAQLRMHGKAELLTPDLRQSLVEIGNTMADEWTQAEQDKAVIKALGLMRIRKLPFNVALADAIRKLRPETGDVAGMTANALAMCADMDLIPMRRRPQFEDRKTLAKEVTEYRAKERRVRDI